MPNRIIQINICYYNQKRQPISCFENLSQDTHKNYYLIAVNLTQIKTKIKNYKFEIK